MDCSHEGFTVVANVTALQGTHGSVDGWMLDLKCICTQCKHPFKFVGLPKGLDLKGAAMSFDAEEAHLAISPDGLPSTDKLSGYRITERSGTT